MPEMYEYHCSKCSTQVKESDVHCPKCKKLLACDGAVKVSKIIISEARAKKREFLYRENFKFLSEYTKKEKDLFRKHDIKDTFPVWACIILHFLTLGIFTVIYFGIKHGRLPRIDSEDPTTGQAIGFMFIPIYHIYWKFIFWLRMTDRLNLQYRLRGKESPINRGFVKTTLILGLIPILFNLYIYLYIPIFIVGCIVYLILMPIVIGITQSASNRLVKEEY